MKIDWFRKIVLGFSQIDDFDGWVIAKVEFDIDDCLCKDIAPHIVKMSRKYAIINVCMRCSFDVNIYTCNMTVYLVKPSDTISNTNEIKENKISENKIRANEVKENKKIENDYINEKLFFKSLYMKKDIENFIDDVGDRNYIHRIEMPVVPGFLMLEELIFKIFQEIKDVEKFLYNGGLHIEIAFYNPLYAFENVKIYSEIEKTYSELKETYSEFEETHSGFIDTMRRPDKDLGKDLDKNLNKDLSKNISKNLNKGSCVKFTALKYGTICSCIFKAKCSHVLCK